MEILRVNKEGQELCYIRCEIHDWFYKGIPPLTLGCPSCWMAFYLGQRCQADPSELGESVDQMEHILSHMQEEISQGKWDFVPFSQPHITIDKEN